jgi:hypothetical protein
MEFYSVTRKNEILLFAGKWMELEDIILSEVSQVQKAKSCMVFFSYIEYRPTTNTEILLNTGYPKGRSHVRGEG